MNIFVKRRFCPTCLLFEITGGPNFQRKYTIFGIFGPKEAPGGSGNLKNGLGMPKNPYFDPSHVYLLPLGAKWWYFVYLSCYIFDYSIHQPSTINFGGPYLGRLSFVRANFLYEAELGPLEATKKKFSRFRQCAPKGPGSGGSGSGGRVPIFFPTTFRIIFWANLGPSKKSAHLK